MCRNILFTIMILLHLNCGLRTAQNKSTPAVHPLHDKIANILQSSWDIAQSGAVINVARREPVSIYTSIALPISGDLRREMIEQSKELIRYQITIEIGERLSEERFLELQSANDQTERELRKMEYGMRDFASKGEYSPETPKDVALYREYQEALRSLPYHRLPDVYDTQNSYYILTSRPG